VELVPLSSFKLRYDMGIVGIGVRLKIGIGYSLTAHPKIIDPES
jgi:hypothetical protein